MKNIILAASLLVWTTVGVVYCDELAAATRGLSHIHQPPLAIAVKPAGPGHQMVAAASDSPRIDLVFALDTTGSMSGMIQAAKAKIWSIAASMANAQVAPHIRVGLVAYRDRGDRYITRTVDLTNDLDAMYAVLMQFQAGGGGDRPESVNQALHEAVTTMSWSDRNDAYKVVFLVGDAPPHMDYADDVKYPETIRIANRRGIVINTIQCGNSRLARRSWQQIASLSQGQYFRVGQSGSGVAVATPYDRKMANLARKLDQTRLTYGSAREREAVARKRSRVDSAMSAVPAAVAARRAAFNASASGKANLLANKDLVADVHSGVVDLDAIGKDRLPAELRYLPAAQVRREIARRATQRQAIQREINALSRQRQAFIKDRLESAGRRKSLDDQIFSTVRKQAGAKGLHYEADGAKY